MKALEGSSHADNTLVVYTADHGLGMGSHGLLGKQNVYEQSMQCPLILQGPGVPSGKSSDAFTYVHDLYSTLCNVAGVPVPGGIGSGAMVSMNSHRLRSAAAAARSSKTSSKPRSSSSISRHHCFPLDIR